ncbi:MAG TPA: hypothetical protein VM286_05125 [Candidatus Thermoplasmatota archaeon]|nr:hypothetical protein [Candidatus Thermoplasmatota archaeon]
MVRLSRPPRAVSPAATLLEPLSALAVDCNVCHVRGVIDLGPMEAGRLGTSWESLGCVFTEGCIGHVWPEALN